ncbi:hypothetical protein Plec18170_009780 [Paecilomyces lecythidis]
MAQTALRTNESQLLDTLVATVQALSSNPTFKNGSVLLDENKRLNQELRAKDRDISELKQKLKELENQKKITYNELLEENHQKRNQNEAQSKEINCFKAIIIEKEQEIKKLQQENRSKNICMDKLNSDSIQLQKGHETALRRVKELEREVKSLQETVQGSSTRLQELQGFVIPYSDHQEEEIRDKFNSLWEDTWNNLSKHFQEDLPNNSLQVSTRYAIVVADAYYSPSKHPRWKDLRHSLDHTTHPVPLPESNTLAAKQMRLVIVSALLAREINDKMFQPVYLSENENGFRDLLCNLAMTDHKKESFLRGMLLAIDPQGQATQEEKNRKMVMEIVGLRLKDLFPQPRFLEIQKSLKAILKQAAEIWGLIQRCRQRYEPDFEPSRWDDFQWVPLSGVERKIGPEDQETNGETIDEAVLTVFPRISRLEHHCRVPLNWTVVLTRLQCVIAEQEQKPTELPSPRGVRTIPDNQKRPLRNRFFSINGKQPGEKQTQQRP